MQAAAKAGRLTRSLAAPCLAVNGGVFVFIAAIVAGALVSAYWMSAGARIAPIIPIATTAIARSAARPEPAPSLTSFTSLGANRTPSELAGAAPLSLQQTTAPAPAPAPEAAEPATACPAYFRWIHEDLRPWRSTGITRKTLERAHRYGPKFRVTVLAGRLYVARYGRCFQTRDVFTQWGILQLLRRHAGRVPDLDLMFDCQDLPVVSAGDHAPPPLFGYCGSEPTLDIAFPDWSFWGWPELNIKPWEALRDGRSAKGTPRCAGRAGRRTRTGRGTRRWAQCGGSSSSATCPASVTGTPGSTRRQATVTWQRYFFGSGKRNIVHFSGLEGAGARWVQGIGLGQAMHAQVQDLRGRPGVVGEREVHPGVRLRGAGGAPEVPRLLLQGPPAAAALLARPRPRPVPVHQVRRGLGQLAPGQGAGNRRKREQVCAGGADDGPCLRLHVSPSERVREATAVQAHGTRRRRGGHGAVHGAWKARTGEGIHGGDDGGRVGRCGPLRDAAALQCRGAGDAEEEESRCGEAGGDVGGGGDEVIKGDKESMMTYGFLACVLDRTFWHRSGGDGRETR